MMMSKSIAHIPKLIFGLAITGSFLLPNQPVTAESIITCKSRDYRYQYCRTNVRSGVELRRQISNTRCREGDSWGYDRGGIWVDKGCSGQFRVRGRSRNDDKYEREYGYERRNRRNRDYDRYDWDNDNYRRRSRNDRYDWDGDEYGNRDPYDYRRRNPSGRNGRYDRDRYDWDDDYDRNRNRSSRKYTINCSSDRDRYRMCRTGITRYDRVVLKKQLSRSSCRRDYSWGYNQNGIWVDRGCRGIFEIYR